MNKYIFALILTLLGWTQIQAQNTDLRSAPNVPKFQVTLAYGTVDHGTVTATVNGQTVTTDTKVDVNSELTLTIVMDSNYRLTLSLIHI